MLPLGPRRLLSRAEAANPPRQPSIANLVDRARNDEPLKVSVELVGRAHFIGLLKELWPEVPIVVLTVFDEPNKILLAIYEGADGYLLKKSSARELKKHLADAVTGATPLAHPERGPRRLEVSQGLSLA